MHKVVDEAILPNKIFKTAQLHLESYSWSCFFKKIALIVKLSYTKRGLRLAIVNKEFHVVFFCETQLQIQTLTNTSAHSSTQPPINAHTYILLLRAPQKNKVGLTNLKINDIK